MNQKFNEYWQDKTEKSFLKYIRVKQHEQAEMMQKAWKIMYGEEKALA